MKKNYWSILFVLLLLAIGGTILFFVHKQSLKAVSIEMFINDETSQVIQMDLSSVELLNELNSLESDPATKTLISQANDFLNKKCSFDNLNGALNFLYDGYQLQTVFVQLENNLTNEWLRRHGFKKVSNGLFSNEVYFLKYQNKNVAFSKSKKQLLNADKSMWTSTMNKDAAIGLMDLNEGFTIDFYLENNVLKQYKSTGKASFENNANELSIFQMIPESTLKYELKSKKHIETLEGEVSWLGDEFIEMKLTNGLVAIASYNGLFHPDELIEEWCAQDSLSKHFLIGDIEMKPLGVSFDHHFLTSYKFAGKYESFMVFSDSKEAIKSWYLSIVSNHLVDVKDVNWIPSNYSSFIMNKKYDEEASLVGHFYRKDGNMRQVLLSNNFSCTKTDMIFEKEVVEMTMSDWSLNINKPVLGKFVKNKMGGSFDFIFQDEKNNLSLVDANGEITWAKMLEEPIINEISSINIRGNGPNFIFNTQSYFYILDEQGKALKGFPVKLPVKATSSVSVLDYDNNQNYRFLIGCENGSVLNFDKNGAIVKGWNYITNGVEISSKIEHFVIDGKDYIQVVDAAGVQNLLGRDGLPRNFDSIKVTIPYIFKKGKNASSSRFYQLTAKGIETTNLIGQKDVLPIALDGMSFVDTYHSKKGDYFVVTISGQLKLISKLGIVELEIPLVDSDIANISFVENKMGDLTYFVISDDKNLYLYNSNGVLQSGFPIETESVFYLLSSEDETLNTVLTYVKGLLKSKALIN